MCTCKFFLRVNNMEIQLLGHKLYEFSALLGPPNFSKKYSTLWCHQPHVSSYCLMFLLIFYFFINALGIQPKTSYMLDKTNTLPPSYNPNLLKESFSLRKDLFKLPGLSLNSLFSPISSPTYNPLGSA